MCKNHLDLMIFSDLIAFNAKRRTKLSAGFKFITTSKKINDAYGKNRILWVGTYVYR